MTLTLLLLLLSCKAKEEPAPLGMRLATDGVIYAGAAQLDVTPEVIETFTDLNGNHQFDGCVDDPSGARCGEPFDDVNGNGLFDAVWIAGFGTNRAATGVHDPITISATVLSYQGEYVALVAMDFVGLHSPRIHQARDALAADGFDPDRLLAASSHNHQGPDVYGIWGEMRNIASPVSGLNPAYQERVAGAIAQAVREAAAGMQPVALRVGRTRMRDESPYFNGALFGGHNPTAKMHGMINDIRDPVVVSDQLLVLQGSGDDGRAVFTLTSWSGHPETWGGDNQQLSADWVGAMRVALAERYGGVAMHLPESLGGMQSALGGDVPLVDEAGELVWSACDAEAIAAADPQCAGSSAGDPRAYADGLPVPVWAPHDSWEFAHSHGWHIAHAAMGALEAGQPIDDATIRMDVEEILVPVENTLYQLMLPFGITEFDSDDLVRTGCSDPSAGCFPVRTFRLEIGPLGFVAVPGELLPEIAWGLPDDPVFAAESADPTQRGPGSRYFPQHDHDCDTLDYDQCLVVEDIGDCDCLAVHAWPYTLSPDPEMPPLLDLLDTEYKAVIGMADHYLSYIVPETDFNRKASYLRRVGDHYEDSVSPAHDFATIVQEAQLRIDARWREGQ